MSLISKIYVLSEHITLLLRYISYWGYNAICIREPKFSQDKFRIKFALHLLIHKKMKRTALDNLSSWLQESQESSYVSLKHLQNHASYPPPTACFN